MVQAGSIIKCADNSGAKQLNVINIPGFSNKRFAGIGEVVVCSVRGTTGIGTTVQDHQVVKAVIVRLRKEVRRKDGSYIRFDDNAGVIIDNQQNPKGTRVFGSVARELRDLKYNKIVSLAQEVW